MVTDPNRFPKLENITKLWCWMMKEVFIKNLKTADTELDAMYLIKPNAPINTEAHSSYVQTQVEK